VTACLVLGWLMAAPSARAQAWAPPAETGSVTIVFQSIANTGHVLTDGSTIPAGKSRNHAIYFEADYAVTDRISVTAGIPFVFAKYLGPRPPAGVPEPPMVRPVDACYCWHMGWQDFNLVGRFNLLNGAVGLTPSVFAGQPSHDYEYVGEAVVGRRLRELGVAADVGVRLDAISPRLAVQGRYAYTWVEQVLGIPNDRSNLSTDLLFLATDRLSVRASVQRQITHGGLRAGTEGPTLPDGYPWGEITTAEQFREHDRLLRDNYWRLGGGMTFSWPRVDVFASYLGFMGGSDTHAGRAFTIGLVMHVGE
jgi:hypothetical protein